MLLELAQTGARDELLSAIQALVPSYRRTPGRPPPELPPVSGQRQDGARATRDGVPDLMNPRPARGLDWLQSLTFR